MVYEYVYLQFTSLVNANMFLEKLLLCHLYGCIELTDVTPFLTNYVDMDTNIQTTDLTQNKKWIMAFTWVAHSIHIPVYMLQSIARLWHNKWQITSTFPLSQK